jgi:hypothetical protein
LLFEGLAPGVILGWTSLRLGAIRAFAGGLSNWHRGYRKRCI